MNRKIIGYWVEIDYADDCIQEVNGRLELGWELLGGPFEIVSKLGQAMVKYEDSEHIKSNDFVILSDDAIISKVSEHMNDIGINILELSNGCSALIVRRVILEIYRLALATRQ